MLAVQPENLMSNANEMCPRVRGEGTEGGLGSSGKTTWRKYYLSWAWLHKQHRWAEWMGKSCRCSTELCWLIAFTPHYCWDTQQVAQSSLTYLLYPSLPAVLSLFLQVPSILITIQPHLGSPPDDSSAGLLTLLL